MLEMDVEFAKAVLDLAEVIEASIELIQKRLDRLEEEYLKEHPARVLPVIELDERQRELAAKYEEML